MTGVTRPSHSPLHQYGQALTEYVAVCAALAFALGIGMSDEHSVLRQLLEALRTAYRNTSYAISFPI